MKILLTIIIAIFLSQFCYSQTDSVTNMDDQYIQYIYNPETNSNNFSYNYSKLWDFDGDKQNDSLFFIGNGGAHTYFYLSIILSSDRKKRDFKSVQIDMPHFASIDNLIKWGKNPGVQFVVNDFNNDGVSDIYINFNNPFGQIPKSWINKGIKTKYILLSFNKNKELVKDYVWHK